MTDSTPATAARSLPSYSELMASLEGTTDALGRLVDAVRGLFDSAGKQAGYDEAVAELRAAHNAAIDWFQSEVTRHGT